jgi:hypothetical protein
MELLWLCIGLMLGVAGRKDADVQLPSIRVVLAPVTFFVGVFGLVMSVLYARFVWSPDDSDTLYSQHFHLSPYVLGVPAAALMIVGAVLACVEATRRRVGQQ